MFDTSFQAQNNGESQKILFEDQLKTTSCWSFRFCQPKKDSLSCSLEDSFNIISRGAFSRQKYQKFSEEIQLLETWRVNGADI